MLTTVRNDLWSPVARRSPSARAPFAGQPKSKPRPTALYSAAQGIAEDANATLDGVFRERLRRTPGAVAYGHYDRSRDRWTGVSWGTMAIRVARWQTALMGLGLHPGERVALMLPNGPDWVAFDQAALVVPAPGALETLARGLGLDMENGNLRHHPALAQALLDRLQPELRTFPGYAKLVRVAIADGPWSTGNGLMTPTLKLRRAAILHRYRADLEHLYDGH